ncbi:MAG: hypothetical protein DRR42_28385, partial [Gammaproteobacteria bacterium]
MPLRFLLSSFVLLALSATIAHAESSCSATLEFANDGSIADWVVCHRGVPQSFVQSAQRRFQVRASVNGTPTVEALQWDRLQRQNDEIAFRATDSRRSFEILRTYHRESDSTLTHSISIRNLLGRPLPEIQLGMELGGSLGTEIQSARTLADYVYGFSRADLATDTDDWRPASSGDQANRFAMTSRHIALVIDGPQLFEIHVDTEMPESTDSRAEPNQWTVDLGPVQLGAYESQIFQHKISVLSTQTNVLAQAGYDGLMFSDLWGPLATLSKWIESAFSGLSRIFGSLGIAVIVLAMAIRLITLPVSLWATRKQNEYQLVADKMKPLIAAVRDKYKGEEQSERIIAIYRENKVTPFTGLKGSVGLFLQIPFLLAVFNVTTASSIFDHQSFLWILDLSQSD